MIKRLIMLLIIVMPIVYADVTVIKKVDQSSVDVGTPVSISLEIMNNYDQDIDLQISDSDIFAGNGVNIECMEATVPAKSKINVPYDPITTYSGGNFTLSPANVTFTDPDGNKKTASSNDLKIKVNGPASQDTQSITDIYNCGNIQRESTRIVSGGNNVGSFTFSFGSGGGIIGMGIPSQQPQGIGEQQQDDNSTALINIIKSNSQFANIANELLDKGYIPQERTINATTNQSGNFVMSFRNGKKNINVVGKVKNGTLVDIYQRKENSSPLIILSVLFIIAVIISTAVYIYSNKKANRPKKHSAGSGGMKKARAETKIDHAQDPKEESEKDNLPKKEKITLEKIAKASPDKLDLDQVSRVLRNYAKSELGTDKELTNRQLIAGLKDKKDKNAKVIEKIISICDAARFSGSLDTESKKEIHSLLKKI